MAICVCVCVCVERKPEVMKQKTAIIKLTLRVVKENHQKNKRNNKIKEEMHKLHVFIYGW